MASQPSSSSSSHDCIACSSLYWPLDRLWLGPDTSLGSSGNKSAYPPFVYSGFKFCLPGLERQMIRFNKSRYDFGVSHEKRLKPILEQILGESLVKTRHLYDVMDFESKSYFVELKSRSPEYWPSDFPTWLIPSCKEAEAKRNSHKKTIFFYYWVSTDDLYRLDYDETVFKPYKREVPSWHLEKQEQMYCKKDDFHLVRAGGWAGDES